MKRKDGCEMLCRRNAAVPLKLIEADAVDRERARDAIGYEALRKSFSVVERGVDLEKRAQEVVMLAMKGG